ncbi:MAG: cyclic nucleotide-binding domain-containing protein [Micromonosporaceae bacterium]|jgi:CRP-like cAMP-binding protein|nr:cyclic nucleotide-binding domain-containing protein [Micromonosporaceae bacterium]
MIVTTYDLLAAHPFLAGLSRPQLSVLSAWGNRSVFHAGTAVFAEGGRATRFWLIRTGHVSLVTRLPGRGDVVVDTLGPGAVLGWSWLFEPYRWHFGAVAVEETLTVEMDGAGVRRLCAEDPELGYELTRRFMAVVVDRLQATRMRLLDVPATPSGAC